MAVVVVGVALALAALLVGWLGSPRLFWIAAVSGEQHLDEIQILAPVALRGSWWLPHLADQLRGMLADAD
jgi:hypothetical protein